jgi:uncharacterized protein GlcG (DUF336 family)
MFRDISVRGCKYLAAELRRNYRPLMAVTCAVTVIVGGCGGGSSSTPPPPDPPPAVADPQPLQVGDVMNVIQKAVNSVNTDMVVAVVDRAGNVLAVYSEGAFRSASPPMVTANYGELHDAQDVAVSLARTGAFFSNNHAPLSSRTVRYISGIHFPPGVANQSNADLYGIESTNRGCTLVDTPAFKTALPPSTALDGGPGLGIITGKANLIDGDPNAVNPGGVPIFSQPNSTANTFVLGGIGVVTASTDLTVAEYAALQGSTAQRADSSDSLGIKSLPTPGEVLIGGIALPFVNQTTIPATFSPVQPPQVLDPNGFRFTPVPSPGPPPDGDLITPANGPLGGLSAADVTTILNNAQATALTTRAAIRLPLGSKTAMVIAVADLDGKLIGLRRMPDATIFSVDVAASKARNMIYFNSDGRTTDDLPGVPIGTAVTNRTISFGAMPLYPPGIGGNPPPDNPGPFFNLFLQDVANPCTQGAQLGPPNVLKSGIVFFPGSAGLYRNGVLIGGLGVSGDGVDQDDYVSNGGTMGFEAPTAIRADQIFDQGVRLPYQKFPRDPTH